MSEIKQNNYEELDGFLFLPSFRESYEIFREQSEELGNEFLREVIYYGTEGRSVSQNPSIRAIMCSVIKTIDKGKAKRIEKKTKAEQRKAAKQAKSVE
jgi:hypothetical protein